MSRIGFPAEHCGTHNVTARFFKEQNLPSHFFNNKYDYCFGYECHESRSDREHYTRGIPSNIYILPIGWRRFGLSISTPREKEFQEWHVAYHGTKLSSVRSILESGLLIPGDATFDGKTIVEMQGHYNDVYKPHEDFDTKQIFVSPSINYASHDAYSPTTKWRKRTTKVVFQLRIKPGSYQIGKNSVAQTNIDTLVDDSKIEWSTKDKDAIMLTGLLVKIF
ncbi:neuralized-like protein 4 [Mytilus galloprovincialis]|uniref:Neuralized-like protein 4 n=1 Tax=Mytilus galloprovincialis TaxID=29158 RepID=A0A8B6HG15_MYTGA|nr:neuralized-like protein 4 [Mytilus galloprovincialis]